MRASFKIAPPVEFRAPEPRMHNRPCKNCPSAHGHSDPESEEIKAWPYAERVTTVFACGWGARRYCRGYCDSMGISAADLAAEHYRRIEGEKRGS